MYMLHVQSTYWTCVRENSKPVWSVLCSCERVGEREREREREIRPHKQVSNKVFKFELMLCTTSLKNAPRQLSGKGGGGSDLLEKLCLPYIYNNNST